jgi:hypothetical protein
MKRKRPTAFYLDEVIDRFSTADLLTEMREFHYKMAADARYTAECKRKDRDVSGKRLHLEFKTPSR